MPSKIKQVVHYLKIRYFGYVFQNLYSIVRALGNNQTLYIFIPILALSLTFHLQIAAEYQTNQHNLRQICGIYCPCISRPLPRFTFEYECEP